jgi:DNA transformation protein
MSAKSRKRAPLASSDSFTHYGLDQLDPLTVIARRMFGGIGLYHEDVFFGIVARDTLYLKVDGGTRSRYERAGMPAFKPFADRPASVNYYAVPVAVLESSMELARWAKDAVAAARSRDAAFTRPKPRAAKRPAARSSPATAATSTAAARRGRTRR